MHKKQKKDDESEWSGGKKKKRLSSNQRFTLHTSEAPNIGNFTSFLMCKPSPDEKLESLRYIPDKRLKEKADSKHSMEDVEWHQRCHQCFKMSLNCLQSEFQSTLEDAQPSSSRSPRKRSS